LAIGGIALTIINGVIGAYMEATGQNPFVGKLMHD
jgi:hypothetical protein